MIITNEECRGLWYNYKMEVEDYNMIAQWSFLLLVSGEEIFNTMMITKEEWDLITAYEVTVKRTKSRTI